MANPDSTILDVLNAYGIHPGEEGAEDIDLPEIGKIRDGEVIYTTSVAEVFEGYDEPLTDDVVAGLDDPRLRNLLGTVEQIIQKQKTEGTPRAWDQPLRFEPPEPHCAWYCPVHFFGHGWGIYIREGCILSCAVEIAGFVNWAAVRAPILEIIRQLLRSAFYAFFLHEQFHHKVESFGLRLLVAAGRDRYRPYKANVYRPTYPTRDCLEESLANAESYRRLGESRYMQRLDNAILGGLHQYLRNSIPAQPASYALGMNYVPEKCYRSGLWTLQSQIRDGTTSTNAPPGHWSVAPNMITPLKDIADRIYVILPLGTRPIFRPTSVDPGAATSSRTLEGALTKHYGYRPVPGGKGSHVKLIKAGAPMIIIPGNRPVVSPGVVKHVLNAVGGYPLSRLRDFLDGTLRGGVPARHG